MRIVWTAQAAPAQVQAVPAMNAQEIAALVVEQVVLAIAQFVPREQPVQ